ncbi:MAG TPA: anaerobic ribonucleoside-triphosphate reductase activating protein [Methylomusa anaerophila]|uniref:Anaerobic ribonucleoside-triphosphate reductase-activating protein n=1 Tax=Methylomusa anaerophila TaxID=1930071 RepID=A0A348AQ97_9FIRM|nr:anaerobic ribonucleoside-triphosphate reductase activating protein [Methylomusa anaerophila]BBB93245.1 pyruvate formate-lyase 1-activating enzyme [Methylomusa anaerophila]HML86923.1 anaerobic ribonucleoside-triphosphate reductase activating protein [Methylomusa anaerophila]
MEIRIAGITKESVVDGPGIRLVVFAQGCPHRCIGCHNPDTHDPNGGQAMSVTDLYGVIEQALNRNRLIHGITFSGGDPFLQYLSFAHLAKLLKKRGLNIVTYTGYTFEQLLGLGVIHPGVRQLLSLTDILVDGLYRQEEKDLRLAFRGSCNQRLIDVPCSLAHGQAVLWEDPANQMRA